jgi:NTE family protein
VDNLPVETMADLGEGPIIAIDVKASLEHGGSRSAPRQRPPSIAETVMRVLLLGTANTSEAARRHADLLIKPRAEDVGLFEFHQIDAARDAGREAARDALEVAPATLFA